MTDVLRLTPQRRAVLEVLRSSPDHPTAAEVFDRVRATSPGIGPATVYRTLAKLVDTGQALELSLTDGAARYDANTGRHDHLVCDSCGRAVDVEAHLPPGVADTIAAEQGFALTGYTMQLRGLCADCQPAPA